MQVRGDWLQIRATEKGVLGPLGYHFEAPPPGAEAHERIFSIVLDDPAKKVRALPLLFHGAAQIYADRDLPALGGRLNRALEIIAAAEDRWAYAVNAVRLGGAYGLYSRDLFNRSSFRIHLARLGVEFAGDPYVELLPSGGFSCRDWGEFEPEFLVAGGPFPRDDREVVDRSGGLAPFMFGVFRMGRITAPELALLARFVRRAPVLSSRSPHALVETLQAA